MYHAGCVFGGVLLLNGGINSEDKTVYGLSIHLYDIEEKFWMDARLPFKS